MKYIDETLTPDEAKAKILEALSGTATVQALEALDLVKSALTAGEPIVVGQDPATKRKTGAKLE